MSVSCTYSYVVWRHAGMAVGTPPHTQTHRPEPVS